MMMDTDLTVKSAVSRRISRWLSIVGAAIAGALIFLIFAAWKWRELASDRFPDWMIIAGFICVIIFIVRQSHGRWVGFFGVRHIASYPPLWLSGGIGFCIVLFLLAGFSRIRLSFGLPCEFAPIFGRISIGVAVFLIGCVAISGMMTFLRARNRRDVLLSNRILQAGSQES